MMDAIARSQSLAGLLEAGSPDAVDWDTSALADWPNIAPEHVTGAGPARASAESSGNIVHRAC